VLLFCVCAVLCVSKGLATGWSPAQGVLPTACRITKLGKAARAQRRATDALMKYWSLCSGIVSWLLGLCPEKLPVRNVGVNSSRTIRDSCICFAVPPRTNALASSYSDLVRSTGYPD
jgi:hypothetical protein